MTQREKLEAHIKELTELLFGNQGVVYGRAQMTAELAKSITELQQLDAGTHFTQIPGDTLGNIVANEIKTTPKKNGA